MIEQVLMTAAKTDADGRIVTSPEVQSDSKALLVTGTYMTALANADTYSPSLKFTDWVEFFGVKYGLVGGHVGDWADLEIVDIDNLLGYGEGLVVAKYGSEVHFVPNDQGTLVFQFKKDVPPGLYLRVKYHNTGAEAVSFVINYFLRRS
jgi:hypothetical protein